MGKPIQMDIFYIIPELVKHIDNKSELIRFVANRIRDSYSNNDCYDTNKNIANGYIIKELNIEQFSRIPSLIFKMKGLKKSKKEEENEEEDYKLNLINNISKSYNQKTNFSSSINKSFIDNRLRSRSFNLKIKNYIESVIESKNNLKSGFSLEKYSKMCLTILRPSRINQENTESKP